MAAAAAAGVRMDGNLSGFTDVRSLHYHGIQSESDASEWISRGMRESGFGGCVGRPREGVGHGRIAKFRYADDERRSADLTTAPPTPNQRPLSGKLSQRSAGDCKASAGSDIVTSSP